MKISELDFGQGCFLIGEVGQNHDGSLGQAHAYIDLIADCGFDAVKFQAHFADAESTIDEKFRINFSYQDETRYDYWRRMELSYDQWCGLAQHAHARDLAFIVTPFSDYAVCELDEIVDIWKVGSGDTQNQLLIASILNTDKPILFSSGMSSWNEVSQAVDVLSFAERKFGLLQCTTSYPTQLDQVGINIISQMMNEFNCPVGLSDHSGTIFPSLKAMAIGCNFIEVHVTFHSGMFGPDVTSSLTPADLKLIAAARDAFHIMDSNILDKDELSTSLSEVREVFGRSIALRADLQEGQKITADNVTLKKPGGGISWDERGEVIGKQVTHFVGCKRLLKWEDIR